MPVPRKRRENRQPQKKKSRDWKQIIWYILSGLIAISMALAYVLSYLAGQ